jgi:hypothetical protein
MQKIDKETSHRCHLTDDFIASEVVGAPSLLGSFIRSYLNPLFAGEVP